MITKLSNATVQCDILSTVSILICEITIKFLITYCFVNISIVMLIISSLLLIVIKPVDTPQKALSQSEKSQSHKKSTALTVSYCFLSVLFLFIKFPGITVALSTGLTLSAALLVLGKIQIRHARHKGF